MKKSVLFAFLVVVLPFASAKAGDDDDFGAWLELGATKNLPRNWSVGLQSELRTKDNSHVVDRWSVGGSVGYKAHKYLKLGVGYSFMYDYHTDKTTKEKYDSDGELESYRITPHYWSPRHRFSVEASSGIKLWKWLRVSGKVKYQFTHTPSLVVNRTDVEVYEQMTPEGLVVERDETPNPKSYDCESRQVLRSRVKFEVDKKRLAWSPFVAVEFHNNVALGEHMSFDKLRTSIGTGYKINKRNDVSLAYVLTVDRREHPYDQMHAICASYSFEF